MQHLLLALDTEVRNRPTARRINIQIEGAHLAIALLEKNGQMVGSRRALRDHGEFKLLPLLRVALVRGECAPTPADSAPVVRLVNAANPHRACLWGAAGERLEVESFPEPHLDRLRDEVRSAAAYGAYIVAAVRLEYHEPPRLPR